MRIKSFNAPTTTEAMAQVRQSLGDEAVIISVHRSRRGGVEITAAIDMSEPEAPSPAAPSAAPSQREMEDLSRLFAWHGLPTRLGERLSAAAAASGVPREQAVAEAIDLLFRFAPLTPGGQRPIMLVGPPGAGKTVTCAKLAARTVMAGQRVTVITSDTVKSGAVEQLGALVKLLQQPLLTVETPQELVRAVRQAAPKPVLIDTPGTNIYNDSDLSDLRAFIGAANCEPVLVLPAGCDAEEASDLAAAFARLGVRRVIVTRLDAARRFGSLLAAAESGDLEFAEFGADPFVAKGLHAASPSTLARLLLRESLPTAPSITEFERAAE